VSLLTQKIFLDNSYAKEVNAEIISKEFKNNKYLIKLNRTIFYPHLAGGQPRDRGTIEGIQVLDVYEEGDDIIHVVNKDINKRYVQLKIQWDHRFDLMQQHTGQHLLSSSFYRLFNVRTLGFHIGRDYIYIDIEKSNLLEDEVRHVEYLSNKIIHSNFPIKTYFINQDRVDSIPLRGDVPKVENIRIVEIDNIDYAACCGTHLSSTGEIGLIKIRRWERYKGNTRVEFVCGNRALDDYNWKSQYINELSSMLSTRDKDVLRRVKILSDQKEKLDKENRKLREDIYQYKGELFYKDIKTLNNINYIIKYIEDTDLKEINFVARYLSQKPNLIQIYGVNNKDVGQFLITRSQDLDIDLKAIFDDISINRDVRGGGSPQLIQGGTSISNLDAVIKSFYNHIRNYYQG